MSNLTAEFFDINPLFQENLDEFLIRYGELQSWRDGSKHPLGEYILYLDDEYGVCAIRAAIETLDWETIAEEQASLRDAYGQGPMDDRNDTVLDVIIGVLEFDCPNREPTLH